MYAWISGESGFLPILGLSLFSFVQAGLASSILTLSCELWVETQEQGWSWVTVLAHSNLWETRCCWHLTYPVLFRKSSTCSRHGDSRCRWGGTDSATHLVAADLSPDCRQIPRTSHTSLVTGHQCKELNPILSHGKTAKRRSWLGFLSSTGSLLELRQALLSAFLE